MAPTWFAKNDGGSQSFSFHSSLIDGTIEAVPADLSDQIAQLVKAGTSVNVEFFVENGNENFWESFEIRDTILGMQTQDRFFYFQNSKKEELMEKIGLYSQTCTTTPFRAFAVAVDVTEGYVNGNFKFSDYLSNSDLDWLNDPDKKSTIYVFSIGYNPIPGWRLWEKINANEIKNIEKQAHDFLSQVPKELDNSAVLSQIHFIVDKMKEFNNPSVVIESDMMENMPDLSAYKIDDEAYNSFIQKNWSNYRSKAMQEAGVHSNPDMNGKLLIKLPEALNNAYGLQKRRHAWYTAIKSYLKDTYPAMDVTSNF
ncbi:hypothetical protein K9M48_00105 [Candidatus Gracilibacteria bacterium]|nr:hypothetical protein [Candidatus Gracilibacteria bacterium]